MTRHSLCDNVCGGFLSNEYPARYITVGDQFGLLRSLGYVYFLCLVSTSLASLLEGDDKTKVVVRGLLVFAVARFTGLGCYSSS